MIDCDGLTKRYAGRTVLDSLDLSVSAGERVAILGTNGAGKTTLFRCLLGLTPFAGRASIDGMEVGPASAEARQRIAYVPQRPPRFDLKLREFFHLFSAARGLESAGAEARAARLGLDSSAHGDKKLGELSGGMLQKAVLALALDAPAPILLLDEPTASLDAESRRRLISVLDELPADRTVLLASHQFEDVVALAGRCLALAEGHVAFDGSTEELRRAAPELPWRPRAERLDQVMVRLFENRVPDGSARVV